jgi:hypothetical protein
MKRHLVRAGTAVGGAGLTGCVLYLIATVPENVHVYWPYGVFAAAILAGVSLYLAGQERRPAAEEDDTSSPTANRRAGPAVTNQWRLTTDVSGEMLQLQGNMMNHLAYRRRPATDSPPSVRFWMKVACAQLDAGASTSDLRAKFLRFLAQSPVMDLLRDLTQIPVSAVWTAHGDNPPSSFAAVLAPPGTEEPPVAWARILLPENPARQYGRDSRCAYLVVCAEPRTSAGTSAPAASLASWYQHLSTALALPAALAGFLTDNLGLPTAAEPTSEVGVWLKAPRALTELVEADAFDTVPGTPRSNSFTGLAVASPDGEQASETALAWLRQMCDSSLHLDDYEPALASLRPQAADVPRLTARFLRSEWRAWRGVAYIHALQVEVANATSSRIRIAEVSLVSSWDGKPPGELPVLSTAEQDALDAEVTELRDRHYGPEFPAVQDVPPHGAVSGWRVTTMPRPPTGATPRLTLTVREAVGRRYMIVIPRTDPQRVPWSDPRVKAAMENEEQLRQEFGFVPLRDFDSGATFLGWVPQLVDHGTRVQFVEEEEVPGPIRSTRTVVETSPKGFLLVSTHRGGLTGAGGADLEVHDGSRTRAGIALNPEEAAEAAGALTAENRGDTPATTTINCGVSSQEISRPGTLTVTRDHDGAAIKIHDGTRTRATARLNTEQAAEAAKALRGNDAK